MDVFGVEPFTGSPLAVVIDADGLITPEMEAITRWMNLSETGFLLPPTSPRADYRVRIFTLAGELPFAGWGAAMCGSPAAGSRGVLGAWSRSAAPDRSTIRVGDRLEFAAHR